MRIIKKHELLPLVSEYLPENPIIIEAGAFNGSDTALIAQFFPSAHIHAFEPVPEIYALLQKKSSSYSHITPHNYALSSSTGTAPFHVSEKPNRPGQPFQAGSLHAPKERLAWSDATYPSLIQVPTIAASEWAQKNNVDHIDFLWLDAQGHELEILKGFSGQQLSHVRVIYCEVQFIHAYENQPLYLEVKSWLEKHNFTQIAQDFTSEQDWFFGNIVCIRNDLL